MKKLYRKNVIHPTPPAVSDHLFYLLPSTLLTLTSTLSPEDRQVLAYLISCSSSSNKFKKTTAAFDHPTCFDCYCFRCYTCYWVKWDSSPNRHVIHEIIDGFEDGLLKKEKGKKEKKNRGKGKVCKEKVKVSVEDDEVKKCDDGLVTDFAEMNDIVFNVVKDEMEEGSIRKFVSFVWEKIWG